MGVFSRESNLGSAPTRNRAKPMNVMLQEINIEEYADRIRNVDTSFTTDTIYNVVCSSDRICLNRVHLEKPITKQFELEDLHARDQLPHFASVARSDDNVCGFIAAEYLSWNKRLAIRHLYVDRLWRQQGIARLLLQAAEVYAIEQGAVHLWVETSNLNMPGICAYQRLGFELCGTDMALYTGTPAAGETALFFSRPVTSTADKNNFGRADAY